MTEIELQQRVLEAYGIRVEPEMCRYVMKKLQQAGAALRELPVIGGEAKTGVPTRRLIDPAVLQMAGK
jgi:hypothetical protein